MNNFRKFLFGSIVAQIKRIHSEKKDQRLITTLQSFAFAKLKDSRSIVARTAQLVLIDSYRKGLWRDAKTANAIADCCFHKIARMQVRRLVLVDRVTNAMNESFVLIGCCAQVLPRFRQGRGGH